MKRLLNSLQFQLYATFGVISALVLVFVVSSSQSLLADDIRAQQSAAAADQRTSAYVLITLMHRYIDTQIDTDRESIRTLVNETVTSTGNILDALRQGSDKLDIVALNQLDLIVILDTVQLQWGQFQTAILAVFTGDAAEFETLMKSVENTGVSFGVYSDRLLKGLSTLGEQSQQSEVAINTALAVLVFLMLVVATWVVVQSVRSINRLGQTAQAFADGDLKVRAQVKTLNEIAQVGSTFNNMAEEISRLVAEMEDQVILSEEARQRAEKSDQVKSAFLAGVSHELRTPLNAIINFSKFVVKGVMGPVNERQTETLNKVVDSGKHLLNLINDVLDISKIEAGALKLLTEPDIDVADTIRQTCGLTGGLLEGKPVRLQVDIANNLPRITTDRQRLRQIITNVLSNACKFTEEGSIKVTARLQNEVIHISVQDTGPGIAPEDFNLVFESFRQTQTGLRQGSGTGLGMPISKSLTEALGGNLWFESEVGQGSTFFVTLPVTNDTVLETQEATRSVA